MSLCLDYFFFPYKIDVFQKKIIYFWSNLILVKLIKTILSVLKVALLIDTYLLSFKISKFCSRWTKSCYNIFRTHLFNLLTNAIANCYWFIILDNWSLSKNENEIKDGDQFKDSFKISDHSILSKMLLIVKDSGLFEIKYFIYWTHDPRIQYYYNFWNKMLIVNLLKATFSSNILTKITFLCL